MKTDQRRLTRPASRIIPFPGTRRPSAIPSPDRMRAKDLAAAEGCSLRTAQRLMASGELGPIHGRSARDRWVDRARYTAWLDSL